jgi:hypothetical protein
MRIKLSLAAIVGCALICASPAFAQTADEIIEKSIAAQGGRAAFAKIKSRLMTGTITLSTPAGDIPGTIEVLNAAPNKVRTLIKADLTAFGAGPLEVDQRFDGQNGYVLDSLQGNRDITGSQLEGMRNNAFPSLFLSYKDLGITARLQGKEKIGDKDVHVVVFEPTKGSPVRQYIDATTMLPVRFSISVHIPQLGSEVEQTNDLSDFRELDGVKVPYKVAASSSVQSYTVEMKSIEHNVAVDEKLFVKP